MFLISVDSTMGMSNAERQKKFRERRDADPEEAKEVFTVLKAEIHERSIKWGRTQA